MKDIIHTTLAPTAIGPYSQAVRAGDFLFISGQIAIDPSIGQLIESDIEGETHQVLKNLKAILEAAGLTLQHVVKCSVFIKDMNLFSRINAVYTLYFNADSPPARELVEVRDLPRSVQIEISAIAYIHLS